MPLGSLFFFVARTDDHPPPPASARIPLPAPHLPVSPGHMEISYPNPSVLRDYGMEGEFEISLGGGLGSRGVAAWAPEEKAKHSFFFGSETAPREQHAPLSKSYRDRWEVPIELLQGGMSRPVDILHTL